MGCKSGHGRGRKQQKLSKQDDARAASQMPPADDEGS
jgi:hypothetical protein